jgi:hypothetical protein
MSRLLGCVLFAITVAAAGCHSQDEKCDHCTTKPSGDAKMTSASDACSHCPGVQTATADGKCPVCGAKTPQ